MQCHSSLQEAMDSHVVKLAEGASELYVPKANGPARHGSLRFGPFAPSPKSEADSTQAWAAVEEASRPAPHFDVLKRGGAPAGTRKT